MVAGQGSITLANNSVCANPALLGEGVGAYGVAIDGCTRLKESNNIAVGNTAGRQVAGIGTASSFESFWLSFTPTLTSSGGGAFTAASAAGIYQRTGNTIRYSVSGTITTAGAASGFLLFTLPLTAAATPAVNDIGAGAQGGAACTSVINASGTTALLAKYDGTATATVTGTFSASGEYRVPA